MNALNFILTDVGRQAMINAAHDGTRDLQITEVSYGSGRYTPETSMTELLNPIKTVPAQAAADVGDGIISVHALDDSTDAYVVYEAGIFATILSTQEKVLLALYSRPDGDPILEKTALSATILDFDLFIGTDGTGTIVEFGDTNFINPPATTTVRGSSFLATAEETALGVNGDKIITPAVFISALGLGEEDGVLTNRLSEAIKGLATEAAEALNTTGIEVLDEKPTNPEVIAKDKILYVYPADDEDSGEVTGEGDGDLGFIDADSQPDPDDLQEGQGVVFPATDLL